MCIWRRVRVHWAEIFKKGITVKVASRKAEWNRPRTLKAPGGGELDGIS